jgi:hypothetical protein
VTISDHVGKKIQNFRLDLNKRCTASQLPPIAIEHEIVKSERHFEAPRLLRILTHTHKHDTGPKNMAIQM